MVSRVRSEEVDPSSLVVGAFYRVGARNWRVGVYLGDMHFIGRRVKFESTYLDTEIAGPPPCSISWIGGRIGDYVLKPPPRENRALTGEVAKRAAARDLTFLSLIEELDARTEALETEVSLQLHANTVWDSEFKPRFVDEHEKDIQQSLIWQRWEELRAEHPDRSSMTRDDREGLLDQARREVAEREGWDPPTTK